MGTGVLTREGAELRGRVGSRQETRIQALMPWRTSALRKSQQEKRMIRTRKVAASRGHVSKGIASLRRKQNTANFCFDKNVQGNGHRAMDVPRGPTGQDLPGEDPTTTQEE